MVQYSVFAIVKNNTTSWYVLRDAYGTNNKERIRIQQKNKRRKKKMNDDDDDELKIALVGAV